MALFNGVFKKRPSSFSTAFLANQLSPITASRKSSSRNVTPRPKEPPPVSPAMNSGDNSMEKIKMYRPHSMLIKETVKIISATTASRRSTGEYWVRRKPASKATNKNVNANKNDRTLHPYSCYSAPGIGLESSCMEPPLLILRLDKDGI